jgi:hypothetical protein
MVQTFEDFLRSAERAGTIDFRMRVESVMVRCLHCYIHPIDRDGATLFFEVKGNTITLQESILIETSEDAA